MVLGLPTWRHRAWNRSSPPGGGLEWRTCALERHSRRWSRICVGGAPTSGAERILEGFGTYLTRERGLVEGTVRFYVHIARLLVDEQIGRAHV